MKNKLEHDMTEKESKVLMIASYPQSLIHFRLHLMRDFLAKGYAVTACAPHDHEVAAHLVKFGIKFIPLPLQRTGLNPLNDLIYTFKLYKAITHERPEIIFSYTIKPVIYGSIVGKICGIKNIFSMITGTGYVFSASNLKSLLVGGIAKILFRFSLKFNNCIFFQNPDNLQVFIKQRLIGRDQNVVLINGSGVDLSAFLPTPYPKQITFLMIARLLIDKGVREYFRAACQVKKMYPTSKFLLVGWLDDNPNAISKNELQTYIDAQVIDYLGHVSDVRPIISLCSVYVLPSYGEGTPRTVLEAMAMARPIITTDVPGCRQTLEHGKNGFLVPVKKVDDLVEAMCEFIHNPELIKRMGILSRVIAVKKYDVHKVNEVILKACFAKESIMMNNPQHTEVIKKRFERDAVAFDAIYDREKSEFSTWFNKAFRKPIFERYEITFQEMGDLKNKSVLDVGCGSGVYAIQCAINGASCVKGIDFSQPMLDIASKRAAASNVSSICEFKLADFLQMELHERYNFVIALGVFDYLIDPLPFLKKMKMAAKTKIIISFPGYSLIRTPLRRLRYYLTAKGKIHFYHYEEIKALVDKVQFKSAEIRPFKTGSGYALIAEL